MNKINSILFCVLCAIGLSVQAQPDPLILKQGLGIKTNVPKQPLHVNGNARIEGSTTIRGYLGLGTNNYQANGLTIWHDSPSVDLWDRDTNILWSTKNYTGELCFIGGMANVDAHYVLKLSTNGDISSQVGRFVGNGSGLTNLNWIWRTNWAGHDPQNYSVDWTNQQVNLYLLSGNASGLSTITLGAVDPTVAGAVASLPRLRFDAGSGTPATIRYGSASAPQTLSFWDWASGVTNMLLSDSNLTILGHMSAKSFSGSGALVTNIAASGLALGPTNTVLTGLSSNNATANTFRGDVAITNLVAYGHKSEVTAIVYGVDTLASGIYTTNTGQIYYEYNQGGTNKLFMFPPNGPNTNYWRIGAGDGDPASMLNVILATNASATLDDNTWTNVSDGAPAYVWLPQDKPSLAADGDVIVGRFLGLGTNAPIANASAVADILFDDGSYIEISDPYGGPQFSMKNSAGGQVAISTGTGSASSQIATDYGLFNYLADYDADDSVTDIDVGFHILTDSEGSLPLWTVLGSMLVTNSIIATNAYGTNEISLPYAQYSASTDQTVTNVDTTNIVVFTDVDLANRITPLTDPGTWSKTYIQEAGAYLITVSAIADLAALPAANLSIWLAVNGVIGGGGAVARSATTISLADATTQHTLAVSFVYNFAQGDYFELWYGGTDTDVLFNATAVDAGPPYIPASPSVIMTVNKISSVP